MHRENKYSQKGSTKKNSSPPQDIIRVALAGNPNSGKSTLFNFLTGSRQRIGNWPGVTVERREGEFTLEGARVLVVDLPGTYALSCVSMDESIARDYILDARPDIIVNIIDATALERNLYLTITLLEMGVPVVVVLNMMDLVEKEGIVIDTDEISKVLDVPVIKAVATQGIGIEEAKKQIVEQAKRAPLDFKLRYGNDIRKNILLIQEKLETSDIALHYPPRWLAIKILEKDTGITQQIEQYEEGRAILRLAGERARKFEQRYGYELEMSIVERRYGFLHGLIKECVSHQKFQTEQRINVTDRIDQVVINKYLGIPIFFVTMFVLFQLVFLLGNPLADVVDIVFGLLSRGAATVLNLIHTPDFIVSLVSEGIISGVGAVVVFLPNILLLFFLISILEDSGYMARAAFVTDRVMHALGLHGKSFIPMLLGFGCSVPAIMGTRILESRKDRLLTILIIPFMSCSARMPIYILFAGAFFAQYQGWVIFGIYILGIFAAIGSAQLFKRVFFREEVAPLIMEMPPYRLPKLKGILFHTWLRGLMFLKKAGTVIVAAVIIVWLLAALPPGAEYGSKQSIMGYVGRGIAPILEPAGFGNWSSAIALIFGFFAKEAVVSTLGTTLGTAGAGLQNALQAQFTPVSAMAFMVFCLLYVPCLPTFVTIWKEAGAKWALFQALYSTTLAWSVAVIIYQLGSLLM